MKNRSKLKTKRKRKRIDSASGGKGGGKKLHGKFATAYREKKGQRKRRGADC